MPAAESCPGSPEPSAWNCARVANARDLAHTHPQVSKSVRGFASADPWGPHLGNITIEMDAPAKSRCPEQACCSDHDPVGANLLSVTGRVPASHKLAAGLRKVARVHRDGDTPACHLCVRPGCRRVRSLERQRAVRRKRGAARRASTSCSGASAGQTMSTASNSRPAFLYTGPLPPSFSMAPQGMGPPCSMLRHAPIRPLGR
jgi:hypothetical protein